jgi:hypothetical protein
MERESMSQSKLRGTFEERKAKAIDEGRAKKYIEKTAARNNPVDFDFETNMALMMTLMSASKRGR